MNPIPLTITGLHQREPHKAINNLGNFGNLGNEIRKVLKFNSMTDARLHGNLGNLGNEIRKELLRLNSL